MSPYIDQPYILISFNMWSSALTDLTKPLYSRYGYDYLWPLPWLIQHPQAAQSDWVRHAVTDPLLRAMEENPGAFLVVDESVGQRSIPDHTDIMRFLTGYPDIAAALKPYRVIRHMDLCLPQKTIGCAFSIWKRVP